MVVGPGPEWAVCGPLQLLPPRAVLPGWSSLILVVLGVVGDWCPVFEECLDHLARLKDVYGSLSVLVVSSEVRGGEDFFHY